MITSYIGHGDYIPNIRFAVTDVIIPDVLHHLRNYQLRLSHENDEVINTYEILAYSQHITVVA